MTLQQLKYVVTVAECGNITEAAKQLFARRSGPSSAAPVPVAVVEREVVLSWA